MTIKECIDNVDSIKPNQYTIKEKVMWLSFIEEIIINDVLKTHEGYDGRYDDFEGYTEDKLSVPLIVPSPYDRLYTAYLKMQIDNENGEMARYNNSAALYNAYMLEFKKHYNKTHMPLDTTGKREAKPLQKAQVGLSDAEYENLVRDLTYKLTEYFSDSVSPDKLYSIVNSFVQNNIELLKGKDGYTPKKGVDYWSEADVNAMTKDVRKMCSDAESARDIAINKALEAKGFSEEAYDYYAGISTMKREVEEKHEEVMSFDVEAIPAYWKAHLDEKMNTIKALQDEGGKDCFSFVVMTDLHYPSNLGKNAPILAKKIMEKCNIKYALTLGDAQDCGSAGTLEDVKAQFEAVSEMFSPISESLLMTQGNHEGSYGEPLNGKTYPYNMTPEELYNRIYATTYKHHNVVTDESGTAYFVDDTARKVRYIVLNSHCNKYEENEDGSVKYSNMTHFRFTQSQYDFLVNKALVLDEEGWSIVVASHAPIINAYADKWGASDSSSTTEGDHNIMRGLLKAFKDKTAYNAEWNGTADGVVGGYTNLFNTTESGFKQESDTVWYTNWLPYDTNANGGNGTIYHFKGATPYKYHFALDKNGTYGDSTDGTALAYCSGANQQANVPADYDESVTLFQHHRSSSTITPYIRFQFFDTPFNPDIVVTADEPIIEGEKAYDAVSVSADFKNAKGEIIGYFSGHMHDDYVYKHSSYGIDIITTRCDAAQDKDELLNERVAGTITEQSFDVFTVNTKTGVINATKIGAGDDRTISYRGENK